MSIENRGPELQAVGYTLVTAAIIATLLRCYTRLFIVRSFGRDDWTMVLGLITFILFVACALVGVHYGTGRHYYDLEEHDRKEAMKFWWYCYIWYCLTMIATKISIGCFLLRITIRRIDAWIIYSVMAVTVLTGVVFFFVTMFQCKPISFFWNKDQNGSCVNMDVIIALTYLYSVCSVICDFTFALLPMVIIWRLNINKRSKVALLPIMAMACIASAAVVVRFPYVKNFKNPDFLYATVDIAIWSCTEQGLAITAGSLATLRPLLRGFGECLGLTSSGPTELPDSDQHNHPATIGGRSSRKRSQQDPLSLTNLDRDDDRDLEHGGRRLDSRDEDDNSAGWESQDNLRRPGEAHFGISREPELRRDGKNHEIVKVQTFSVTTEERF